MSLILEYEIGHFSVLPFSARIYRKSCVLFCPCLGGTFLDKHARNYVIVRELLNCEHSLRIVSHLVQ